MLDSSAPPIRILVVDDHALLRDALAHDLARNVTSRSQVLPPP
jgi:hypothetical protein